MSRIYFRFALVITAALALTVPAVLAQTSQAISLTVDATHAPEKIVRTHMVIPAKPGPLTLHYPKWIPGEHGPDGPIANLTGLKFSAGGKSIPWHRDLSDIFTFHVDVPPGAAQLDASFDYLEPSGSGVFTAAASATDKLIVISWNQNVLYPAGASADQIKIQAKLVLPSGWKFGTALPVEKQSPGEVSFQAVSLERLVDSPVIAGEYYRSIDLTPPGESVHHETDMVADSQAALNMSPQAQKLMVNLVAESGKLFGTRHYRDYHFLLTLSDHVAHFGLEHHESNDSRLPERALLMPNANVALGGLLAHEFAHSWNGKFRRPGDLTTANYDVPMKTDLLWVYEGLTDYLGPLLAARSGLWHAEEYQDHIATIAAALGEGRPGRTWRPLLDTAVAVAGGGGGGRGWLSWRRGTDYYDEGDLLWLEVATIIHRESHGQKSIDDFCHLFHGSANSGPEIKPYTFEEVVSTLNQTAPYDWAGFLHERLNSTSPSSPQGGIETSGWKFIFNAEPQKAGGRRGRIGEEYSLGLQLGDDGSVNDSIVDGPAFRAGVSSGMKVAGVNARVFTREVLKDAIDGSKESAEPITLLVVDDEYYKTCVIDYHGGPRYPHLVRDENKPDYLDELIKSRAGSE